MKSTTASLTAFVSMRVFLVPALFALCFTQMATAASFTDGFEGPTINPFWEATGTGTAALTNSTAHSGSQSLNLTQPVNFRHDFGSDQSGSVSVWVRQQLCCGAAVGLQIEDANRDWLAVLQQAGNNNDPSSFIARVNGSPESDYFFSATPSDWHLFEINAGPGGLTFKFDGAAVFTNPSVTKFRVVNLTVWGGFGGSANFDDFASDTSALGIEAEIDIKPGEVPNSINLGSNGTVPVAILSTHTFDATTVNPATVTLAGAHVRLRGKGVPMASFEDVNGDGLVDLVVHINIAALQLGGADTTATLNGQTFNGEFIKGTDSVRVIH